jgi:hypothetical protein
MVFWIMEKLDGKTEFFFGIGKGSSLPLLEKPSVPQHVAQCSPSLTWIFERKSQDAVFCFTNYYYYYYLLLFILFTFLKII